MKRLRVLLLMHEDLVPPENPDRLSDTDFHRIKTECDILDALEALGHVSKAIGIRNDLEPIGDAVREWKPDVVFNLLDEFRGEAVFDQHIVAHLELLGVAYTGNNPRGMVLARDKALSKKVVAYHGIHAPGFFVAPRSRKVARPKELGFPLIVKSLIEEASMGISKASVVRTDRALEERVAFIHERIETDAIVEQFIPGREIYVGLLGNERITALPPRELIIGTLRPGEDLVATESLKHSAIYQKKQDVRVTSAQRLARGAESLLERISKDIYRMLDLEGYARIDYRLHEETGDFYFLEANPNPELANYEELASAAAQSGLSYEALIQKVLTLALLREKTRAAARAD